MSPSVNPSPGVTETGNLSVCCRIFWSSKARNNIDKQYTGECGTPFAGAEWLLHSQNRAWIPSVCGEPDENTGEYLWKAGAQG